MKFVDEARARVQAGNGGRGSASFRREKFVPFGGPDGGDGGDGGSVYLRAAPGINTLADFRIERTYRASHGEPGGARDCTGRSGADLYIPVPVGTTVREAETGEELGDLACEGEVLLVARGGKGGWGNQRFQSSTNRAPTQFAMRGRSSRSSRNSASTWPRSRAGWCSTSAIYCLTRMPRNVRARSCAGCDFAARTTSSPAQRAGGRRSSRKRL